MNRSKSICRYNTLFSALAVVLILYVLTACGAGSELSPIADTKEESATLHITVPNMAPWLREVSEDTFSTKAWLRANQVKFSLFEDPTHGEVVDEITVYSSDNVTDWVIAPGTYYLYSYVYNESSDLWLTGTEENGYLQYYPTVWGVYPDQDPFAPTTPFTISAGDHQSVVVTNVPMYPVELVDNYYSSTFSILSTGEKWFSFTTGPTDNFFWVHLVSLAESGTFDADMNIYLFGPDGLYIAGSYGSSDGSTSTDDYEYMDSDTNNFAVIGGATYFLGVECVESGDFYVGISTVQ